jgi:DNA polymerase (family 10)
MATANAGVARILQELADLMKLEEGSPQSFRVRAYEKAVGAVRELTTDVADMSQSQLVAVNGIGASTAKKILEFVTTGTIERVEKLRAKYPPDFVELTRIPGVGPKTAVLMRAELGVENVEHLKAAIAASRVRDLPGMGAKSEDKIARAIERLGLHGKDRRTPIQQAMPLARELVAAVESLPEVRRATYCGSLRRFRDTIGDIDIVAASNEPEPVMEAFLALPIVAETIGRGETKSSVLTAAGLQIDLRVVAPSEYGAATLYFTGSKAHNIELRQRAIDRGWTLNEYSLADAETEDVISSRTENAIYEALGLRYIAPELREGIGEIQAAATNGLPRLVEIDDIKGDLHVHSTWSGDGRSSLDEMVEAAADRGLEYIAMTEHGEDLTINGLSRDEVAAEAEELERLRGEYPDLTILHGSELNIGPDGGLDYDLEFLLAYDWCVASVHSHFDLPQAEQTERLLTAIAHPAVNVIGHPTGRMIGRRPGIEFDLDAVLEAAAETGTALEINCHLDRLDLPAEMLRHARERDDIVFIISTDSHHTREYDHLRWGVANARRGWVDRRHVANTWPKDRFMKWAAQQRKRT